MNHLIVCREFPPAPGGGIGTYTSQVAGALVEAGETVHVIAQRWPGAERDVTTSHGGRLIVHRVPVTAPGRLLAERMHPDLHDPVARAFVRRGLPALAFAWQVAPLVTELAGHGIDIIEGPEYEAPLAFYQQQRAVRAANGPPVIVHLHSPTASIASHNRWAPRADRRVTIALETASIRAADALLSPSRFLASEVSQSVGVDDITVIPYPFRAPHTVAARQPRAPDLLFAGRLEGRKGAEEWIDAAIALAGESPAPTFTFAGADVLADPAAGRVPAALRNRFRFLGPQDRDAMAALYAGASVVVVPSRWDNLPFTCIEAMAAGVPVLASPHGGMAELLTPECGWVADAATPEALAAAGRRILATVPDERARMGVVARDRVAAHCGWEAVVPQQLAFRRSLPTARGARSAVTWPTMAELMTPAPSRVLAAARETLRHPVHMMRRLAGRRS